MSKCHIVEEVYSAPYTIVERSVQLAGGDTLGTANSIIPFPKVRKVSPIGGSIGNIYQSASATMI